MNAIVVKRKRKQKFVVYLIVGIIIANNLKREYLADKFLKIFI